MKSMLTFVLFAALLCWVSFNPLHKHVLVMRQAVIQQEVDYLLDIGANASHGYISLDMIEQSRARLAERGFDSEKLDYIVGSTTGGGGDSASRPVLRGDGLKLEILYPYGDLFALDRLMGMTPVDPHDKMSGRGIKMSEYLPERSP